MLDNVTSVLFLYSVFALVLYLMRTKKYSVIGLLLIILLSSIRWDVGHDYENYFWRVYHLNLYGLVDHNYDTGAILGRTESSFIVITRLCQLLLPKNYVIIGVMAIYAAITYTLLYLALKKENSLFWGFFAYIFGGLLFLSWDQTRQCTAVAVFLYSIQYIRTSDLKKYLICCFVGYLFHTSAIIVIPFYWLAKIKLSNKTIIVSLIILTIGFYSHLWLSFFGSFFSLVDKYALYADTRIANVQQASSGLGIIGKILIYSILILTTRKNAPIYSNILFFGLAIYLFSCTNDMVERLSSYGIAAIVFTLPALMRQKNTQVILFIKIGIISALLTLGIYGGYKGQSGAVPFDTIFSQNFDHTSFRLRSYMIKRHN